MFAFVNITLVSADVAIGVVVVFVIVVWHHV